MSRPKELSQTDSNAELGRKLNTLTTSKQIGELTKDFTHAAMGIIYDETYPLSVRGLLMNGFYYSENPVGALKRMADPFNINETLSDQETRQITVPASTPDDAPETRSGMLVGIVGAKEQEGEVYFEGVAALGKPKQKKLVAVVVKQDGEISLHPQYTSKDLRLSPRERFSRIVEIYPVTPKSE